MITRELRWSWQHRDIALGLDEAGSGPLLLLLPALSSISTRAEMHPLMERLRSRFRVLALDWPGFGTAPRPGLRWTPDALSAFLRDALDRLGERPHGVVAAGHGATYLLHHAARHAGFTDRIVLVAPTWRGPLPTMAGGDRPLFARIRRFVELPGLGPLLYRLNVSSLVIRRMVSGHVYSDPAWLDGGRLRDKRLVVDAKGARFASVAFVTGALDRIASRAEFLALACGAGAPILLVYGAETPPRSLAEIEALAALPGVQTARLARGKLAVHEEFPDDVAAAVGGFLGL
ncbi:MAG TPA: alpha/beta hydrolase [Xanthobacteraceae bacterium]|jgi:pimeloyl-ACP methyl ester carboxylesterase